MKIKPDSISQLALPSVAFSKKSEISLTLEKAALATSWRSLLLGNGGARLESKNSWLR